MRMKHVVSAALNRQTILVTGFGAFPGAPQNPTVAIIECLEGSRRRLERAGVQLRTCVLPVVYADVDSALREAVRRDRPDAILHLGLASRRRRICVEARAINRVSCLQPDASGRAPASPGLAPHAPRIASATYSARKIVAAIERLGLPVHLSVNAGDYVCNATLYWSLLAKAAPQIGFIHVPRPIRFVQTSDRVEAGRLSEAELTRAVLAAVLVMMRHRPTSTQFSVPTARPTDVAPECP